MCFIELYNKSNAKIIISNVDYNSEKEVREETKKYIISNYLQKENWTYFRYIKKENNRVIYTDKISRCFEEELK